MINDAVDIMDTTHTSDNLVNAAKLSVAPMMEWTDRHCRYFHRLLCRNALLYTEMVTAAALVRGGALHLLDHDAAERPVALQLGGSVPAELAAATALGVQAGYREINLNVGCPSDRVQSGEFGAVLMKSPRLVAQCCAAMADVQGADVTVKCRIGVDDQDPAQILPEFLGAIADAGVTRVIIHARKAWLQGLSPKENREVPPLDYPLVFEMKQRFPHLHMSINGGVMTLAQAQALLAQGLDGVMVGRAAYHDPAAVLCGADQGIWGDDAGLDPFAAVQAMVPYTRAHLATGGKLGQVTRHMLGLFTGRPGARAWRRFLSENAHRAGADETLLLQALSLVPNQPVA